MVKLVWSLPDDQPVPNDHIVMKAALAEFIGMNIFVTLGCASAMANGKLTDAANRTEVALTFGLCIAVLAYAIGHHSGGQMNAAVTFSLCLVGKVSWLQGAANMIAQLYGSAVASFQLVLIFNCETDQTLNLGSNYPSPTYDIYNVLWVEVLGTFMLCYVVFKTAVYKNSRTGPLTCLTIGLTVFILHLVLLPIDGCSINPPRSTGPAFVSWLVNCPNRAPAGNVLWIFWVGPLTGGALAALAYRAMHGGEQDVVAMTIEQGRALRQSIAATSSSRQSQGMSLEAANGQTVAASSD